MKTHGLDAEVEVRIVDDGIKRDEINIHHRIVASANGIDQVTVARFDYQFRQIVFAREPLLSDDHSLVVAFQTGGFLDGERPNDFWEGTPICLRPLAARLFNNRGLAQHKRGAFSQSSADFSKAVELDPEYAQAFYNLACAQARLGRKTAGIKSLKRSITLKPQVFKKKAKNDQDLDSLRGDPAFLTLIE